MSINCYAGLQGTGKSYEVVSSVIVPAIAAGRRVVSNISGLDNDRVREYCTFKFGLAPEFLGTVVNVSDEQVRAVDFFPNMAMAEGGEITSTVLPGDLVAVDEAYKIWGTGVKIPAEHLVFFREHRHYTHPETGVSCDLVLMTQDIAVDLHRSLRAVIGNSFKTHKAKGVGLNTVYTLTMWEGWKQNKKHIVNDWTKTYDPAFFPLYKSYAGTKQGKEMNTDARMNIFAGRKLWIKIAVFVCIALFVLYRLVNYWYAKVQPEADKKTGPAVAMASVQASRAAAAVASKAAASAPRLSSSFRIVGNVIVQGEPFVVLKGPRGVRLVSAVGFTGSGFAQAGTVDGELVTPFSGVGSLEGSK